MNNEPFDENTAGRRTPPGRDDAAETVRRRGAATRERDALQDRLLRTAAEFDNYRKRIDRERREQAEYGRRRLLLEICCRSSTTSSARCRRRPAATPTAFARGVELIHRQMLDLLRKRGVTPIDALGADFDPRVHQAVMPGAERRRIATAR